ncbi:MAG: DUF126 domain-containing protein [Actinomycetota bacterium]
MTKPDSVIDGAAIIPGETRGSVVVLDEALSFWGGFDAESGLVIDEYHPQRGTRLSGRVVVLPEGRGSSSASSVIAEAARLGTAPAAFVVRRSDEILATGAVVAAELYGRPLPIVKVDAEGWERAAAATELAVAADGTLTVS